MTDLQLYLSTKSGSDLAFDSLEFQAWSLAKSIITAAEAQQVAASEDGVVTTLHLEPKGTVHISRFPREHCVLLDFEMTSTYWPITLETLREIQYRWDDDEVTLVVGEPHPSTGHLATTHRLMLGDLLRPSNPQPPVLLPRLPKRLDPNQMELPLFA